jgi:serine/threonine-protein kinase
MDADETVRMPGAAIFEGRVLSHYRILDYVGQGGMGVVWKAQDLRLNRTVALKFLPDWTGPDTQAEALFQVEAQAAAALDHPAICAVYDLDQAEGLWFIAMAYIDGESLAARIRRGPVPVNDAVRYTSQVVEGLEAAHARQIVHHDVKSSNIMINREGQAKILDFGVASIAGVRYGEGPFGTPAYMSPEQARGLKVDHRTDLWSVGVVLYEMLSARLPFEAKSAASLLMQVAHTQPRPFECPSESKGLRRIVAKALAQQLDARYQTAAEMLADLRMLGSTTGNCSVPTAVGLDSRRPRPPEASIVVLPFVNLSSDPENEYFSDGLADELINAMAQVQGLHVISRTSAFSLKGKTESIRRIGEILNVNSVLEGSVRKSGNRLRITAQLVHASSEQHVWAQRYDREIEDVFAIQEEIARKVVGAIKPKLLSGDRQLFAGIYTERVHVYNLYLQGTHSLRQMTPAACELARNYFEQALREDSDYAPAHAAMAYYHYTLGAFNIVPPRDALPKALQFVLKALELDNSLGEAHARLGDILMDLEWDWEGAGREMRRAVELTPGQSDPRYSYMLLLMKLERYDEALEQMQVALKLDPLALHLNSGLAYLNYYQRNYDQALEACHKTIELDPNYFEVYGCLGLVRAERSQFDEAIEAFAKARQLSGDHPLSLAFLAYAYALADKRESARDLLGQLLDLSKSVYISPGYIALIYIGLGEFDEAFAWLDRACDARDFLLTFLRILHAFDPLRTDPRFVPLLEKVGLAEKAAPTQTR